MVVDIIAGAALLAILALFRYAWKNRKRHDPLYAKRLAEAQAFRRRKVERIGKIKANGAP